MLKIILKDQISRIIESLAFITCSNWVTPFSIQRNPKSRSRLPDRRAKLNPTFFQFPDNYHIISFFSFESWPDDFFKSKELIKRRGFYFSHFDNGKQCPNNNE